MAKKKAAPKSDGPIVITERQKAAMVELNKIAASIYDDFDHHRIPNLELAVRSKSNIQFEDELNVWKYGESLTERSARRRRPGPSPPTAGSPGRAASPAPGSRGGGRR